MNKLAPILLVLLSAAPPAFAQSAVAQREIAGLIHGLGTSQCEFNRNGQWYNAAKAQSHLQAKYDYLRKRKLVDTAELFIERAASRSSVSGKAYRVRCPGKVEQDAAAWFATQLQTQRRSSATSP